MRPAAGLIVANVVWGSSYVVVKVALRELSPTSLAALRVTLAALLLWLLWLAVPRLSRRLSDLRGPEPVSAWSAARMAGLGLFGIALSYLLGYRGIGLTTATDASLMVIGEVIFTSLLAVMRLLLATSITTAMFKPSTAGQHARGVLDDAAVADLARLLGAAGQS